MLGSATDSLLQVIIQHRQRLAGGLRALTHGEQCQNNVLLLRALLHAALQQTGGHSLTAAGSTSRRGSPGGISMARRMHCQCELIPNCRHRVGQNCF